MSTIERPPKLEGNGGVTAPKMRTPDVYTEYAEPKGAGWVLFSAIMLGLGGIWGVIGGILAIDASKLYVADATFVFSDLNTWGWIVLALGALSIVAAFSLFSGSELARWYGITIAGLSAIGHLMFVEANPWWAMAVFALNILVIYGLAAYGGRRLTL